jgi:hypothetical protein
MRNLLIGIAALFITLSGCAGDQEKTGYKAFYSYFKDYDNIITFKVPAGFAQFIVSKDDEARDFLKNMDHISFLIVENDAKTIKGELETFLPKSTYKEIMVVKDGGSTVRFLAYEKGEAINEIIMVVDEADELVVMGIHGRFTKEDAKLIAKSINKDQAVKFRN